MRKRDFPPTHPGEMLAEDFLTPMNISSRELARDISVPYVEIAGLIHGHRPMTAELALRLGQFFGMEAQFWVNLQARYDLETARDQLADRLEQEVRRHVA